MLDNDTYLIFANRPFINRINVDGNFFHIIAEHDGQIALGIDFDYRYVFPREKIVPIREKASRLENSLF